MYCPVAILVKVSILLQYITLFVVNRGSAFHYVIHMVIWTNVVFYTIVFFLVIFQVFWVPYCSCTKWTTNYQQCTPSAKEWDESLTGHCTSEHQLSISTAAINVVSDFVILVLPFHRIWNLQMHWKRKSKILAVFTIGLLACLSSVVRLVYSVQLSQVSNTDAASPAQQLATDKDGLWGFAEIALGIIAGCTPIIPRFFKQPLFVKLSDNSWLGSKGHQSSGNSSRSFGSPRRFDKPSSNKFPTNLVSSEQSPSAKANDRKEFYGIETQRSTKTPMKLSGSTLLTMPSAIYRIDSQSPLVTKSASPNEARDVEWQEMSAIEKGKLSIETKRDRLEG